jgi:hypothetical protein
MSIFVDENDKNTDTKKFMDYTKISTVTYFNRGAYGIGYSVKINDLAKSGYNVISLNNTDQTLTCGRLFVKLVPVFDDKQNTELPALIDELLEMDVTTSDDFLNEIRVQTEVYKKTNNNLEAVCPPIVYSNIVNNTSEKSRAQNLLSVMINNMPNDENKVFLHSMKSLYEANGTLKLGVIAMSFAENYDTLWNVMKKTTNSAQRIMYQYLAAYELLRLYDIGYMHGDYHMKNILINTQYRYNKLEDIYLGRCLIIDYGLAFKNKYVDVPTVDEPSVKLHVITQEKQPLTNQNAYSWDSYKWLVTFLQSESDLNSGYTMLKEAIDSFQEEMVTKINENYPTVMERIRAINSSKYRGSILKGGRELMDTTSSVNMNMDMNMDNTTALMNEGVMATKNNMIKTTNTTDILKPNNLKINFVANKEPLTNNEFENIFNPSNMDMNEIVDKYENTIQEGIIILDNNITSGGKKNMGKRKMKPIRRTKRSRKMKRTKKTKRSKRTKKMKRTKNVNRMK